MAKVLMIGIDGATFTLLDPFMESGVMPYLKSLVARGTRGYLMSTANPLTPPAWVSMVTGRSPEAHGVFDFMHPLPMADGVYMLLNDSRNLRCETIWSMASRQGKRVTSLNFYGMSPPMAVDGYLISGFVPWKHLRSATYPPSFFPTLKQLPNLDYKLLGFDVSEEKKSIQGIAPEEHEAWILKHSQRGQAWYHCLAHLMATDSTDLTAVVFDGPDKLQHLFWRYLDPALTGGFDTPWDLHLRELCLRHYQELDEIIRQLVERAGEDTNVIFTSDHGFGATTEVVYLNEWLARQGYLRWREGREVEAVEGKLTANRLKEHLMTVDWSATCAYCPTPSSNAIHLKGVPPEEYGEFCHKLRQELLDYRHPEDGGQVFVGVDINAARLVGEPCIEYAPDLVVRLRDGGFVSILPAPAVVIQRVYPEGTHRPNGIFIACGPDIRRGQQVDPLSILDITPLILHLLDLPVPADLEGRVPVEVLNHAATVRRGGLTQNHQTLESAEMSEEDQAVLLAQLQQLGYMD